MKQANQTCGDWSSLDSDIFLSERIKDFNPRFTELLQVGQKRLHQCTQIFRFVWALNYTDNKNPMMRLALSAKIRRGSSEDPHTIPTFFKHWETINAELKQDVAIAVLDKRMSLKSSTIVCFGKDGSSNHLLDPSGVPSGLISFQLQFCSCNEI